MKKVLLDTNAYCRLLTGDKKILFAIARADKVYMSIFVLGELYYGFRSGKRELENKRVLNRFLDKPTVEILDASQETAEIFAQIKYDIWIASHTMETGSVLLTYDQHFIKIKGLRIWNA